MDIRLRNNSVWRKIDDLIPNDTLSGKIFRGAIYCFIICLPIYLYESYFGNTLQLLQTSCSTLKLTPEDTQKLNDAMSLTGFGKNAMSTCTLLPVPNTELNTTSISLFKQLTSFTIPFFGSIFYFFATNFIVFACLAFMYWGIVEGHYPALGKTYLRQYITCGAAFLIATAVMLPTVSSLQVFSLKFNGVNYNRLAIDNRMLCSTEHVFEIMAKQNAIPSTKAGYRIVQFSDKQNAIVCFGRKLSNLPQVPTVPKNPTLTYIIKFFTNLLIFAFIPFFLVIFLNLFKKLLNKIINR